MLTAARSIFSLLALAGAVAAAPISTSALCPKGKGDEIVVCADADSPVSRYRAPLRGGPPAFGTRASASVSAERNGLFDYDAGTRGCSNVGAGGAFGCAYNGLKRSATQRANARDPRGRIYDAPPN